MSPSVWTRVACIGLVACAVAALAASAPGQELRRDGSKAVPFVAQVSTQADATGRQPVLRRDGSKAVPFVADPGPQLAAQAADDFDWRDAVIGAGLGATIALLAMVGIRGARSHAGSAKDTKRGGIKLSAATPSEGPK